MIDEIFDRNYQHGRADLNAALDSAVASFGDVVAKAFNAFKVLNRIEYSAPWLANRRRVRSN